MVASDGSVPTLAHVLETFNGTLPLAIAASITSFAAGGWLATWNAGKAPGTGVGAAVLSAGRDVLSGAALHAYASSSGASHRRLMAATRRTSHCPEQGSGAQT